MGILRTMHGVTGAAALSLDHRMLKFEGTGVVGMATGTAGVACGHGAGHGFAGDRMGIVAGGALHLAFRNRMVEGLGKGILHFAVALVAECWLLGLEQVLRALCIVNAVAADAAQFGFAMGRAQKVGMRLLVAAQAAGIQFAGRNLGRSKDLVLVAIAHGVLFASTVAGLAGGAFAVVHGGQLVMRIGGKFASLGGMAGGAGLLANKGIARRRLLGQQQTFACQQKQRQNGQRQGPQRPGARA